MVTQYPHTVTIQGTAQATKNSSGKWTPGSDAEVQVTGRFEPNSGNGMVNTSDGVAKRYDGIVYMPLPIQTILPGTPVIVKNGNEVLLKGSVLRFSAGQMNARVWL